MKVNLQKYIDSHFNSPTVPFSFVKWWMELVTPRCLNFSPVSRETGGCLQEAVTYAGPDKNTHLVVCLGQADFLFSK